MRCPLLRRHGEARATTATKLSVVAIALALLGLLGGAGTWAAFAARTSSGANSLASGTVAIGDNDAGSALFSLTGLTPSTTDRCILVTYGGSLAASVRLYGTTGGTGLDSYLTLTVTRGSGLSGAAGSCTGFVADATNYSGLGPGILYSGTLAGFPDTYGAGLVDPTAGWASGEAHAYKLSVTLPNDNNAAGKNASQDFTWEARNA
jgi:predicted ribosomally synthesized peptide with SipW-like signal peptide